MVIRENQAPCFGLYWPEYQKVCPMCSSPAYEEAHIVDHIHEIQDEEG